ncbi:MAG TPA: triose-phosphate isomerase [Acidimicrobiia bacterium]|nr:triose-phosphate isomerase [Acidimicrobiia bacterium]
MARKDLIAGNWKMNATHLEAIQMVQKLSYRLDPDDYDRVDVVVCPPYTALRSVQTVIEADHLRIHLGAQDAHWEESGAFTGAVSAPMLEKLGVEFVIVGHSERRQVFGEDDVTVAKKLRAVLGAGMTPILAVGETLEQRDEGETDQVVSGQVRAALRGLAAGTLAEIVIAYEPVWAIGSGRTADPDTAAAAASVIRSVVSEAAGVETAASVRVLYGGSVNPGNIAAFMAKREIDGALVGGASLDPDQFASIVRYWV